LNNINKKLQLILTILQKADIVYYGCMLVTTDNRRIGPLHIVSNKGEIFDVILEQLDYGLLALNTGVFAVDPSPPRVTDLASNQTYVSVCQKLDLLSHTTYPKTTQTISFKPSNSPQPVSIVVNGGPPWPSPPWPPQPPVVSTRYLFEITNNHSKT
jgi:hypothetical protein